MTSFRIVVVKLYVVTKHRVELRIAELSDIDANSSFKYELVVMITLDAL